jgi:hypothetical protein
MDNNKFYAHTNFSGSIDRISFQSVAHHQIPESWKKLGIRLASSYRYQKAKQAEVKNAKATEPEYGNTLTEFMAIITAQNAKEITRRVSYKSDYQIGETVAFVIDNYYFMAEFMKWVKAGGKTLKGPASTGLILGKSAWIEAVRTNGAPFQRLARAFKVGKEEIAGIVTAVEQYVNLDHAAEFDGWERVINAWVNELSIIPKIKVLKEDLNEAGQPIPRVAIHFSSDIALEAVAALQELDPIVEVVHNFRNTIWLSADGLQKGEEKVVTEQVKKALAKLNL